MLRAIKFALIVPALLLGFQSQAATQDLDQLLKSIKADIQNKRLSSPAGNNALERITAFREQAPFDFRVVPLTYEWGEAYVALANNAMANGQYGKAQSYLEKVWYVASLTPGLEQAQARLDAELKGSGGKAAKAETKVAKGPSKEEIARQKKVAQQLAKEKARLEADRKRKLEQAKKEALAEKKRLEAELKRKQEEERQRRLAAAEAEKQAAAQRAKAAAAGKAVVKAAPKPVKVAKKVSKAEKNAASELWQSAKEDTAPLASYPISAEQIANRDRSISDDLEPVCQAILDNDASVVVHTPDKADYRWLTVRLTLCLRRLDTSFRLRHSHQLVSDEGPFVTLHPPRGVSLVRKVEP